MKRFALYHLETLLWISRLGTFAAAAERLNTTQPAISARIREFESQIGYPLFQRAGRKMALTVRGRQLVKECEPLWTSIERTLLHNSDFSGASGTLRIGAGEIAAAKCLPPFLAEVKQDFSKAMLEIEIDLSHSLLQKLLSAERDLVIVAGEISTPDVRAVRLGSLNLCWITSPRTYSRIVDGNVRQLVWLLHRRSPIHALALESLDDAGCAHVLEQTAYNSCNNIRALADIVAADGGIGFVPEQMVKEFLADGRLVRLPKLPDKQIAFFAAIRTQERDPLVCAVFERAAMMTIA